MTWVLVSVEVFGGRGIKFFPSAVSTNLTSTEIAPILARGIAGRSPLSERSKSTASLGFLRRCIKDYAEINLFVSGLYHSLNSGSP
jgi:hypothetical protein